MAIQPKWALAAGMLLTFYGCQWSGLISKPLPITLQVQDAPLIFSGDDSTDLLTHQSPSDFQRGLLQEQLELLPQGGLRLKSSAKQGRFLSPVLATPFLANRILPGWQTQNTHPNQVSLRLRFSPDGKTWSTWLPLRQERTLELPQKAQAIQYEILFTNLQTSNSPVFKGVTLRFGQSLQLQPQRLTSPLPTVPKPLLIEREAWGAAEPKEPYETHIPDGIIIHHTWKPRHADYRQAATIRGIQRYHMQERNWKDIGYHFLIGPEGAIYQGRPETVIGAHATPNTGKIGICLIGDFDPGQDPLTEASRAALLDLLTWLTATYQIQTTEFFGHRDFNPKSCPGEEVYRHLSVFKEEVRRRLGLGSEPAPPASPLPPPDAPPLFFFPVSGH